MLIYLLLFILFTNKNNKNNFNEIKKVFKIYKNIINKLNLNIFCDAKIHNQKGKSQLLTQTEEKKLIIFYLKEIEKLGHQYSGSYESNLIKDKLDSITASNSIYNKKPIQ